MSKKKSDNIVEIKPAPADKRAGDIVVNVRDITLTVDANALGDMRTVYIMGKVANDNAPEMERIKWYISLIEHIIRDDAMTIMDALADQNGGTVSPEDFADFLGEVMSAVDAKN